MLYGVQHEVKGQDVAHWRRLVWRVARTGKVVPTDQAFEITYTVHAKGHRVDVGQNLDYDAVMAYARLEERADAETKADMTALWTAVRQPGHDKKTSGPIARMHERDKSLGGVLQGLRDKFGHRRER